MPTNGEIEINGEASLIAIGIGMNNFLFRNRKHRIKSSYDGI